MKIFISHKFTGEDIDYLHQLIDPVIEALNQKNINSYCTLYQQGEFDRNKKSKGTILKENAFAHLDECSHVLVIQHTENRSEGMLTEVGYAIAKNKKIIVATKSDMKNTYLPEIADKAISWSDLDDLVEEISKLEF